MAIFTPKETENAYLAQGSPVFRCFLDAPKAFDKLNYSKLFEILQNKGVPICPISLLSQIRNMLSSGEICSRYPLG